MRLPDELEALQGARRVLARLLGVPEESAVLERREAPHAPDAVVRIRGFAFALEWKAKATVASVDQAVRQARAHGSDTVIATVVVPYMNDLGAELCAEAGIGWLDLSGNAEIHSDDLHIVIRGNSNQFKRRGRPSSVFAPKSSRVARWMLMHPREWWTQSEIAKNTNLSNGYVSRIAARLESLDLVVRDEHRAIKPRDPQLLLKAWNEVYDFSKHDVTKGHIPARSGEALLDTVARRFEAASVAYAATGLAAAWLLDRFASFRTVTVYVAGPISDAPLDDLAFRQGAHGANTWLVQPRDDGVFHGARLVGGVRCVHPVQAYLDLGYQPERAEEAAEHLREQVLDLVNDA